ncbi:ABC transporter permease [Aquibacillus sediminis]|uniref:ABC transporter permease n=1 Tax=Aquibacillus sediminis TaxID=2574734 RepID=UPI001109436D|nr:ABC transporter permease [Aquibacillus sediminis]
MNNKVRKRKYSLRQRTIAKIVIALVLLLIMVVSSLLIGPDRLGVNLDLRNQSPSLDFLFGTDWLGRDMLARTLKGLVLSLGVGVLAAFASTCIALLLSLVAAWSSWTDRLVSWLIDLFLSVPHLVTLILISFTVGGGFKGVVIGLSLTHWPSLTRVLRAELLQIKQAEYIQVSKRLGKTRGWIARHHYLPHLMPQLLIGFTLLFPHAILHEAAVTFLGFGLSAEQPAIGVILSESMNYLTTGMWWLAFFPGLSLVCMVALFDLLGQSVRKMIDPYHAMK